MLSILLFVLAFIPACLGVSQIALFSDSNCQDSLRGLEGPNGYPNGTCTDIRRAGPYGSFQVVGLDPGCAVTIYVADPTTTICGGYQEEIQLASCHNSTFVYYSIDMCDPAGAGASSTSLAQPTSKAKESSESSKSSTPVIVGGVLGGLLGLCIILGLVLFLLRKKRRAQQDSGHSGESSMVYGHQPHAYAPQELPTSVVYKCKAVEVEQPPAELAGSEMRELSEKKA